MANREETSSPDYHCVLVETNLNTRLVLLVHKDEIISDFKDNLLKEHKQVFPEIGEINVSALKVKRRRQFYHFSDSMNVCKAFHGIRRDWFIYVDAVRVEKDDEVLAIMAADQNGSKLELGEKNKEIAIGMFTKDLTLEKKTRKRKMISSDVKKSRKKLMIDVNQSVVASRSCLASPREQVDDIVSGAMGKDIESGENKDITMGENQQASDGDRQLEGKILTVNLEIVDKVKDVPESETLNQVLEKPDDLTGTIVEDIEKGEKNAELVKIDQEKDLQPASELVDEQITSRDEGSSLAPSAADNLQTAELVTYAKNSSSGLTNGTATEKKRKRMKSSKDQIRNQSTDVAATTSREIVNEINQVPGNDDSVDVASESHPISIRENLGKESGKALPSSADNIQTENLASTGLTTGPATEKKKRKKSSKDHINQSLVAATTPSRETVNDREKVSGSIDRVNATSESFSHSIGVKLADTFVDAMHNEDGIGEKMETTEATLTSGDNLQVADLVSTPHTLVQESKTLDNIGKFTDENKSGEHEVSKKKVDVDVDQAKSVKSTKKKSSRKAKTLAAKEDTVVDSGAQNVEPIKVVDGEGPDNVIRNVLDSLQQRDEAEENRDNSGKKSSKSSKKKQCVNVVEVQVLDSLQLRNETEVNVDESGKKSSKRSKKKHSFGSNQNNDEIVGGVNKQDQMTGGAKSKKEKNPGGSIDGSVKPKERKSKVQPASSGGNSLLQSGVKNDCSGSKVDHADTSVKIAVNSKKEAVKKSLDSVTVNKSKMNVSNKKEAVKKRSNSVTVNKSKMNFFGDSDKSNSSDDEYKTISDVSTKSPSDSSADDDDSDVTSMSKKQGNNVVGGTNRFSGSLQDILRSSKSYKKAKLTASQSQPDEFNDESTGLDFVPDSQAI